jgi:hypothetical protein
MLYYWCEYYRLNSSSSLAAIAVTSCVKLLLLQDAIVLITLICGR